MSLCPLEQWHSVFSGSPQEMHSSSSRQGKESVQVFPVLCHFVALFHSSAPSPFIAWFWISWSFIHRVMHRSTCSSIHPSANNLPYLSLGCVLLQQHLIKRHVMVRRHQSCPKALHSYRSWCSNQQISERCTDSGGPSPLLLPSSEPRPC